MSLMWPCKSPLVSRKCSTAAAPLPSSGPWACQSAAHRWDTEWGRRAPERDPSPAGQRGSRAGRGSFAAMTDFYVY